jgi:hypothetical protein
VADHFGVLIAALHDRLFLWADKGDSRRAS